MANTPVNFYLPPGRMVGGSLHVPQTKDMQGRDREKPSLYFAVAVPKTDPRVNDVLNVIANTARSFYGNHPSIKAQLDMGLNAHNFAWKVSDGDGEKDKTRPGRPGCWIFHFSTSFESIECGDSQNNQINPATIKPGYYIDVSASVKANELLDKNAGMYLNPRGVRLLGYGEEIPIGQTIGQMFADMPAALPPGASALPVATGNPLGHPPATAGATPPAPPPGGGMVGMSAPPPPPPAATPAPPPPASLQPAAPAVLTVEQIQAQSAELARAANVQHYPGFRINAARTGYDPDPTPSGAQVAAAPGLGGNTAPAMVGGLAAAPTSPSNGAALAAPGNPMSAGAAAPGVPAGATPLGAPSTGPNGFPATASPSNPPVGVQPHPGFLQPPAQKSQDEISAEIAAGLGVQHHPGWRCRPDRSGYDPNPAG